jgi:plasmid maintenance system killer protein
MVTFSKASDLQIEEYLAEDFRKYMLRGGKPKGTDKVKNSIFRDIWNALKALFSGTTIAEMAADETADGIIGEMYNKLSVGNLYEYTFSADNMQFGELNKGVVATDPESAVQALSFEDSKLLVDTIDSLFSEWEDMKNSNLTPDQMLERIDLENQLEATDNVKEKKALQDKIDSYNAKQTYEFTSEVFKETDKNRLPAYKYARSRIGNMYMQRREEYLNADNSTTKARLKKEALLLRWAWDNFGTLEIDGLDEFDDAAVILAKNKADEGVDPKGLVSYHMSKSEIYFDQFEEKLENEDRDNTDQNVKGRRYERGGADLSMKEQADPKILYLMKGLHKTDKDGLKVKNRLGFYQLVEFQEVWNRTARTTQNTLDIQLMESKLNAEVEGYPVFKQLLNKLGPVESGKVATAGDEVALWTNFWKAFNHTRVPLIQVNIEKQKKKVRGQVAYEARSGEAHNSDTNIGRRWNNEFHIGTTKYIKHDIQGNYLDLADESIQGREREFLHAIGWKIADHPGVLEGLAKKDDVLWIYKTVAGIHARGMEVRNFDDITSVEAPAQRIDGKPWMALETIKSGRFKRVMQYHSKFSDEASNFLVSNAEGNNQYEHSLNNSLTIMINAINSAPDYRSLIAMPHMSHLNIENNPFAKYSNLLNSIYNLDTTDPDKYGKKRLLSGPGSAQNQIDFSNLSGIMLSEEGGTSMDGIAAAKADPVTKQILDFHLNGQLGMTELARHADKSTSYAAGVQKVKTKTGLQSKWINNFTFLTGETVYNDEAYNLLINPIAAEFNRIKTMRDMTKPTDIDFAYWQAGQNFVAFDDVLTQDTQEMFFENLDQAGDLKTFLATEAGAPLQEAIRKDLADYFKERVKITTKSFNKNPFVANNLYKDVRDEAKSNGLTQQVKDSDAKDALIKSYVYNHWINNIETINLFYGDLALYNHEKEQFHKRNAGMGSTGTLYRTDTAMQNLVNNTLGRPYSDKKGGNYDPYNGSMATAVIRDNNVKSAYYDQYVKAFKDQFISEGLAPKAAETKAEKVLYAYSGAKGGQMNEGDAQGWISFDSYRILLNSEGNWSPQQENLYQDVINGKSISPDQLMTFFPTVKAQYYGPLQNDMKGLPVTAMHKFSLLPLIPTVIKGTNLENLHQKMMDEGVDYSLFESGSKVGTITKNGKSDPFYEDGRSKLSKEKFTKNTIFLNYLKNQLEIAPKYKGKVIFSTQLRKLIEDGLMENGVPTDFMEKTDRSNSKAVSKRITAWNKLNDAQKRKKSKRYSLVKDYENNIALLTDIKKRQLLTEMNWTSKMVKGKEVLDGDIKDLIKKVKTDLSRKDIADHELDFLNTVNGKLKQDLSLSLSVDKIEKLLNALVVNKLIKQKVKGEGLVQISGALFESMASTGDRSYTNATPEQLEKYGTNDLPTYHIGKDGKTTAMKVKIALQGDFLLLLDAKHNDGTQIRTINRLNEMVRDNKWLNTDRNREMITMTGVRIPVQGLNSMEFMEVYEFLPKEAGSIIVPPAEIVAKSGSDFDIDKLSVMMPNLKKKSKANAYTRMFNYTEAEAKADYRRYVEAKKSPFFQKAGAKIDRETGEREIKSFADYNSLVAIIGFDNIYDVDEDLEKILLDEGDIVKEQVFIDSLIGAKAVENDLIANIKSILELPENFTNLVRPNSTDIFSNEDGDGIAQELKDYVLEYNPTDVINGKTRTNEDGKEIISPTRALEIEYNMYKHATNNVGKQTLGLGAVDNTYNTIFNRIGFHLNPSVGISPTEYNRIQAKPFGKRTKAENDSANNYRRQKLFLPHNTLEVKGEDAISLSHDKDANGEHRIADVINQLMNGWVDIAADTWIFNIQGNKEVSPILLFLLQAGVPAKSAVYFASQPMVRAYVEEQRSAKGTLAEPLNKAPRDQEGKIQPFWFRSQARKEIFKNPAFGFNMNDKQLRNVSTTINKEAIAQISGKNLNKDGHFDEKKMLATIKNHSKALKAGKEYEHSDMERAAFLHFLEVEAMAMPVRDVKLNMNFDTSKSETLFEAQNRIIMKEKLKLDGRIPTEMVEKMLDESPLGSFYIQPFQMEMWKDLFTLRNHNSLNDFIVEKMGEKGFSDDVKSTFGDTERFANELRNDFVNFIFQNSIRAFNPNTTTYRNYEVNQKIYDIKTELDKIPQGKENKRRIALEKQIGTIIGIPVSDVTSLRYGISRALDKGALVIKEDAQLYVDKRQLNKDFMDKLYSKTQYKNRGLALVDSQAFETVDEYYNFVYERESLRTVQPYEAIKDNLVYTNLRSKVGSEEGNEQREDENDDSYDKRLNKIAYEQYLRDTALTNTFNHWALFKSDNSYADQFNTIRATYGEELSEKYSIIDMLSIDSSNTHTNLKLNDNFLESDMLNLLHENLLNLANPSVQKVDNVEDNKVISEYFKKMGVVAFLQSGMNTKSAFSLTRIVPEDTYLRMIEGPVKEYVKHLDKSDDSNKTPPILERFYKMFVSVNDIQNRASRIRGKKYNTEYKLSKSIKDLSIPLQEREAVKDPDVSPYLVEIGTEGMNGYYPEVFEGKVSRAKADLSANPNIAFIYSFAIDNQSARKSSDSSLYQTGLKNAIGLPLLKNFNEDMDQLTDVDGTISEENRIGIEDGIRMIKEAQASGKRIAWNRDGYGQYMIGEHFNENDVAKETFLYLSKRLFEEFKFINPNYLATPEGLTQIQSGQPISDAVVYDFMQHCK